MADLTRDQYIELLVMAEDLRQMDVPKNFDRKTLDEQFFKLAIKILHDLGWGCEVYPTRPHPESSRYAVILLPTDISLITPPNANYQNSILVSNFGNLVTLNDRRWPIRPEVVDRLLSAIHDSGFTFIPMTILDEPYTGEFLERHNFRSWFNRFFNATTQWPATMEESDVIQKREADIARLKKSDDPNIEIPDNQDPQLEKMFLALSESVSREIGVDCKKRYDDLQDVTYFGEILLPNDVLLCPPPQNQQCFQRIIVSNFGNLATIAEADWPLNPDIHARLQKLIAEAGFHYIPYSTLQLSYEGPHTNDFGSWFDRFFGWS